MEPDIVTIWTYHDYVKAEMAKIQLEAAEIPCFISGDNAIATNWYYSIFSEIELCVKFCDAQKAIEILKNPEPLEDVESDEHGPIELCPYCGGEDVELQKISRTVFFLSVLILRMPLPFPSKKHRCLNCYRTWRLKSE